MPLDRSSNFELFMYRKKKLRTSDLEIEPRDVTGCDETMPLSWP